jgi:hypothetical protein
LNSIGNLAVFKCALTHSICSVSFFPVLHLNNELSQVLKPFCKSNDNKNMTLGKDSVWLNSGALDATLPQRSSRATKKNCSSRTVIGGKSSRRL